ncbi:MAG: type III CRISPR-associated RAMP protein Csx7 [Promethearchaeota archaeon]
MNYLNHGKLLRKINIYGDLIAKSRIHIGAGRSQESLFIETENPIIKIKKDGIDLPYIPGSSLKGIFRSACESLLKTASFGTCNLDENIKCYEVGRDLEILKKENVKEELLAKINELCYACKIFGGNGYASNIYILDALPREIMNVQTGISPGIAINRRDGTVIRGAYFTFEHVNPNSLFNFELQIQNLPNFLLGLLFSVIFLINEQVVLVGGKKRAGLGKIALTIKRVVYESINPKDGKITSIIVDYYDIVEKNHSKNIEKIIIEKIEDESINDFPIEINIDELKNLSYNEFSSKLISYFMEAWYKFVETK